MTKAFGNLYWTGAIIILVVATGCSKPEQTPAVSRGVETEHVVSSPTPAQAAKPAVPAAKPPAPAAEPPAPAAGLDAAAPAEGPHSDTREERSASETKTENVSVPALVGLLRADAETALSSAGLKLGAATEVFDAAIPAGSIVGQEPAAGAGVSPGSMVNLAVSRGPEPVAVPQVTGIAREQAAAALTAAGLVAGTIAEQNSESVPTGHVLSQDPLAGASVARGSAVQLVVSLGPETVAVPILIGLSRPEAEAVLAAAKLLPGTLVPIPSEEVPEGYVVGQQPDAGVTVATGAAIDLAVSAGSPPPPPPAPKTPADAK